MRLREGQRSVLDYAGGRMAVSAVPGSGKTSTLSWLAANLIAGEPGGDVLVVTFSNSGVANFKSRIATRLQEIGRPRQVGYEVRTLHSLSHLIVQEDPGMAGLDEEYHIAGDRECEGILREVAYYWMAQHASRWQAAIGAQQPDLSRWQGDLAKLARLVIRTAKTARRRPEEVLLALRRLDDAPDVLLAHMAGEVYGLYQQQLTNRAAIDFNDLIWLAYDLLERRPDLLDRLRRRWPFVLEDEAQDSSPLQEQILTLLVGEGGNWVRVGDPNQAINATFTSADPRFFRRFCRRDDVTLVQLDQSGRSATGIIDLANALVDWACHDYPEPAIRQRAFEWQMIRPVDTDDPQPNPPAEARAVQLSQTYSNWQEELDTVVSRAIRFVQNRPECTVAILAPTNFLGEELIRRLRFAGADFDELLRTPSSALTVGRLLWQAMHYALSPERSASLAALFDALWDVGALPKGAGVDRTRGKALLAGTRPEAFVFPEPGKLRRQALPARQDLTADDYVTLDCFGDLVQRWVSASVWPVEDFVLTVAGDLFTGAQDLAVAQQVAMLLRRMSDDRPDWGLTELAGELHQMAFSSRGLLGMARDELGYTPQPGRITVSTQHSAKGLEWDLVYVVGADLEWFPQLPADCYVRTLGGLVGDYEAEVGALLRGLLMAGDDDLAWGGRRTPTEEAQLDTIAERLRLLYVSITRARRYLSISWSEQHPVGDGLRTVTTGIAPALEELRGRRT